MRVGGLILVSIHCTVCVSVLCVHVEVKIFTTLCLVYHTLHQFSSHLSHDILYMYICVYIMSFCFYLTLLYARGCIAIVFDFSQGLRNDLKDAMDKLDQEYLTQLAMQQVHMCTKYE